MLIVAKSTVTNNRTIMRLDSVFMDLYLILDCRLCSICDFVAYQGQPSLTGLSGNRRIMVVHEADEFCHRGIRLVPHLPREPVEACMNPVQITVFIAWWPVLIL